MDKASLLSEFNMGWILLLHIIWTKSNLVNRGKWVGGRFELTGKDVLQTRLEEDGRKWKDVSRKAVQLFTDSYVISIII